MAWALGDTGVKAALYFWAPEVPLLRGQSGLFRKARPGDVCVYDLPAVGQEQVTELPLCAVSGRGASSGGFHENVCSCTW